MLCETNEHCVKQISIFLYQYTVKQIKKLFLNQVYIFICSFIVHSISKKEHIKYNYHNEKHRSNMILRLSCTFFFFRMIGQGVASLSPGLTFLRLLSKLSKPILAGQYWPLLQNCTTSTHYLLINCFPQKYELSLSSSKMFKQRRQKSE